MMCTYILPKYIITLSTNKGEIVMLLLAVVKNTPIEQKDTNRAKSTKEDNRLIEMVLFLHLQTVRFSSEK